MDRSGTVVRIGRKVATVLIPPGPHGEPESLFRCALGGRLFGSRDRRPPGTAAVVGDEVLVEEIEPGGRQPSRPGRPGGRITAVLPRKTALRLIDRVREACRHVAMSVESGSPRYGHELNLPGLRCWPVRSFPYLIFYMTARGRVDVWRALHRERDIPAWMYEGEGGG